MNKNKVNKKAAVKKTAAKKTKAVKRNEFRKHKPSGHPAHIYERVGDEFKFIGITHAQISQGIKNIPLVKNPDPKDSKKSYAKPKPQKDRVNKFKKKEEGWKFSKKDQPTIDKIKKRHTTDK